MEIRPTKRSTYRRLNQMNGDYLSCLRKPLCSEMNGQVIGTNKAKSAQMKRTVDLWYRERDIKLARLQRSQDAVYTTMLRNNKQRKQIQRESYRRHQEDARQDSRRWKDDQESSAPAVASVASRTAPLKQDINVLAHRTDKSDRIKTDTDNSHKYPTSKNGRKVANNISTGVGLDISTTQPIRKSAAVGLPPGHHGTTVDMKNRSRNSNHTNGDQNAVDRPAETCDYTPSRERFESKSKVLEIRKSDSLQPLIRERSLSDSTREDSSLEKFSNIKEPLLQNRYCSPTTTQSQRGNENINNTSGRPVKTKREENAGIKSNTPRGHAATEAHYKTNMSTISEGSSSVHPSEPNSRHTNGSVPPSKRRRRRSLPHVTTNSTDQNKPSSFSDGDTDAGNWTDSEVEAKKKSLVELNKNRAKQREQYMHEVLEKEAFTLYVKNRSGAIVPSDAPFKRQEFVVPSMRETHFRNKMLRAEVGAREQQLQKLDQLLENINREDREREVKMREALQRRQKDLEEEEEKRLRAMRESGFSFQQMMAAFAQQGRLPSDLDPNSYEALKLCKYIRLYDPLNPEVDHKSSWKD